MTVAIPLKKKYREPGKTKRGSGETHSGTVVKKRRAVDNRKHTGQGRDWYR
jgi:hypothetical protein